MGMEYKNASIEEYLGKLSSREIVPGGGSVSALSAALGAGLNLMVINFTFKPDLSGSVVSELNELLDAQTKIKERLIRLIDEDCDVFKELMRTLSDKRDPQESFKNAAIVPLEICRLCERTLQITGRMLEIGNKNLLCDIGCACNLIKAALDSAGLNVEVNTKHINDKNFVDNAKEEMSDISRRVNCAAEDILKKVKGIFRG